MILSIQGSLAVETSWAKAFAWSIVFLVIFQENVIRSGQASQETLFNKIRLDEMKGKNECTWECAGVLEQWSLLYFSPLQDSD